MHEEVCHAKLNIPCVNMNIHEPRSKASYNSAISNYKSLVYTLSSY